ncbi:MAG: ParB N-terminal domain-containing protein [Pseudomonadota bacterium]
MARRRRIEAPSAEELKRLDEATAEAGFAAKPKMAPIAQVAAEAATLGSPLNAEAQEAAARDRADAAALRRARDEGWEVRDLPIADIQTDAFNRDRMALDPAAMEELRNSIRANGLRMPVEVTVREKGGYDLISGLRRLVATRDVSGPDAHIRAFIRQPKATPDALVAMIEENEIRANLTSYERGRAAVSAVEDGAFATLEDAVNALFASASKAKRSKVRSFALVHEELGDLLVFPQALSERQCLRLATAIKAGQGGALRAALATGMGTDADLEWAQMASVLAASDRAQKKTAAPKARQVRAQDRGYIELANGMGIRHVTDASGHALRFEGPVDQTLVEAVMLEIERLLAPSGR